MDKADMIANGDRPVVQEGPVEGTIEIVWPDGDNRVMDEELAMTMFAEMMRIVSGEMVDSSERDN